MNIFFKWSLRFSVYLRQKWNSSHFTWCMVLMCSTVGFNMLDSGPVGKILLGMLMLALVWFCVDKSNKHNKPSNVEPLTWPMVATLFVYMHVLLDIPVALYMGDYLKAMWLSVDTVALVLAGTPGYKIPYEPDNLNYAPEGA